MKKDARMCKKFQLCHSFTPQNPTITPALQRNPHTPSIKTVRFISFRLFSLYLSLSKTTQTSFLYLSLTFSHLHDIYT